MLLKLAYLGVTNAFAMLRLLPLSDRNKDVEILALRHQITVLERQLNGQRPRLAATSWISSRVATAHEFLIDARLGGEVEVLQLSGVAVKEPCKVAVQEAADASERRLRFTLCPVGGRRCPVRVVHP